MAVTAAMVKELRELSGAGMVECKNALTETDGDIKKAIDYLREKGLAAAAKKAGRIAAEGVVEVLVSEDGNKAIVIEINSETDFVAKNADFKAFVSQVANQALKSNAKNVDELLKETSDADSSVTVAQALSQKIAIIGENLTIRRFESMTRTNEGFFASYIHGDGKMGVLVNFETSVVNDVVKEAGRNICMQIAAMYPKYLSKNEIPAEFIEKETEILKVQALNEGKPANVVEKMIVGRLQKQLKEYCLLEQQYVKDGDLTVSQYLANVGKEVGATITPVAFISYERGEGIEKKEENFADEVNKAMNS